MINMTMTIRSVFIYSSILSTLTLFSTIIVLPIFFFHAQRKNTAILSLVRDCHIEGSDLWKRISQKELYYRKIRQSIMTRQIDGVACCSCQQGPKGSPGQPGNPGKPGEDGPEGHNGHNGRDGRYVTQIQSDQQHCQKCPPAKRGLSGIPGMKGPRGPPGLSGEVGKDVSIGQKGPPGPTGIRGPPGPIGQQGPRGDPGRVLNGAPQGLPGPLGPVGPQGPRGLAGREGTSGIMGVMGNRGAQGSRGPDGLPGNQGPPGVIGPPGAKGTCAHCKNDPNSSSEYEDIFVHSDRQYLNQPKSGAGGPYGYNIEPNDYETQHKVGESPQKKVYRFGKQKTTSKKPPLASKNRGFKIKGL